MIVLEYNGKLISENKRLSRMKNGHYYTTKEYKEIKQLYINSFEKIKLEKPYKFAIYVYTYKDIDNVLKPIFDAMQEKGIIEDDKYIIHLDVRKIIQKRNEKEKIIVTTLIN